MNLLCLVALGLIGICLIILGLAGFLFAWAISGGHYREYDYYADSEEADEPPVLSSPHHASSPALQDR